ncbi:hypothetical protein RRG08_009158 [Elysia crispata]|uniref:Integrase catalytic domain-containing protein n=1 Tax=Elysia crispata TaxID=231223 RepID=A0AAE1AZT1_9GAST|nr:hypothetical protein RRG08_029733 [Elysia crispata]KAK3796211.1 hypothetical protein RRG08_009158 [Elysia crispata]
MQLPTLGIVAVDFVKMEFSTDGKEDILVMTGVFTRWIVAVVPRDQSLASVVRALAQNWVIHYGVPARIHFDQGRCFEAGRSPAVRILRHQQIKEDSILSPGHATLPPRTLSPPTTSAVKFLQRFIDVHPNSSLRSISRGRASWTECAGLSCQYQRFRWYHKLRQSH